MELGTRRGAWQFQVKQGAAPKTPVGSTAKATGEGAGQEYTNNEEQLWQAVKSDNAEAAQQQLFDAYLPLAKSIAGRHFAKRTGDDIEYPDMFQLACAGLLEAIAAFDTDHGAPFPAFARKRINGSVLDGIGKTSELREQLSYRARARRDRTQSLRRSSIDRLDGEDAMQALVDLATGLAIGFMLEGTTLYVEKDTSDQKPNAYESLVWKDAVARVAEQVEALPKRETQIIQRHYFDGLTFDQIAGLLGVSKGRISQMHRKSLELLRKRLSKVDIFRVKG